MEQLFKVVALPEASKRTKERIQQHGPIFKLSKKNHGSGEVYLISPKDNWFGWLPMNEIELRRGVVVESLNDHQPDPIKNKNIAIWDLVIYDMKERDQTASKKYGTRLQPFNGRDALIDAYQEALDLAVYLRQAIFELTGE